MDELLEKIEKSIAGDTFHPGDVLTIDISNEVTLDQEYQMYTTARDALARRSCGFVKIKMRRPVSA